MPQPLYLIWKITHVWSMFAIYIGGEMRPITSTHEIILFKYAKVYRINLILLDRPIGQNIATNVYTTVLLSRQIAKEITARTLSKTAYPVIARALRCKHG